MFNKDFKKFIIQQFCFFHFGSHLVMVPVYPFLFLDTDEVAATTSHLDSVANAIILDYPVFPAVPECSFTYLLVLENFSFTLDTLYSEHYIDCG